jgi:hypothetical protein
MRDASFRSACAVQQVASLSQASTIHTSKWPCAFVGKPVGIESSHGKEFVAGRYSLPAISPVVTRHTGNGESSLRCLASGQSGPVLEEREQASSAEAYDLQNSSKKGMRKLWLDVNEMVMVF